MLTCWKVLLIIMILFLCVYSLVDRIAQCIEYCAFAKAFSKFKEAGIKISVKELRDTIECATRKE